MLLYPASREGIIPRFSVAVNLFSENYSGTTYKSRTGEGVISPGVVPSRPTYYSVPQRKTKRWPTRVRFCVP